MDGTSARILCFAPDEGCGMRLMTLGGMHVSKRNCGRVLRGWSQVLCVRLVTRGFRPTGNILIAANRDAVLRITCIVHAVFLVVRACWIDLVAAEGLAAAAAGWEKPCVT